MFAYIWPIALVVISNVFYHICAKSVPNELNPLAALSITYLIGAVVSGLLFFILNKGENLVKETAKMNWAPFVLGIVIVGLEVGNIYAYKAGWEISVEAIVQSSVLAIALLVVGAVCFNEAFTWNKALGVVICLIGLVFINK